MIPSLAELALIHHAAGHVCCLVVPASENKFADAD
jgi:hypothetical protein